jgi:hypothetical protein
MDRCGLKNYFTEYTSIDVVLSRMRYYYHPHLHPLTFCLESGFFVEHALPPVTFERLC